MRMMLTLIGLNAVSIVLAIGAVVLLILGIDGWGWLLFGAIVLYATPKSISSSKDENQLKNEQ